VQWKGEGPETATWEPTENLNPSMVEQFNHTLSGILLLTIELFRWIAYSWIKIECSE
jgi:hypothetical protein